jgi:hypothetical protein
MPGRPGTEDLEQGPGCGGKLGRQATAVALVGIPTGISHGIAAGKAAWRVFATNFGVLPVSVVDAADLLRAE